MSVYVRVYIHTRACVHVYIHTDDYIHILQTSMLLTVCIAPNNNNFFTVKNVLEGLPVSPACDRDCTPTAQSQVFSPPPPHPPPTYPLSRAFSLSAPFRVCVYMYVLLHTHTHT